MCSLWNLGSEWLSLKIGRLIYPKGQAFDLKLGKGQASDLKLGKGNRVPKGSFWCKAYKRLRLSF
jgi:hypothetical protein